MADAQLSYFLIFHYLITKVNLLLIVTTQTLTGSASLQTSIFTETKTCFVQFSIPGFIQINETTVYKTPASRVWGK